MRYSADWETIAGLQIAVLRDAERQAELRVAPALGNTCVGYRLGDWQVLDEPPDEAELLHRASSYGIPILFPWPNRIRDARFTWEDREYRVPPSAGSSHANHGLIRNRPWKVIRFEVDAAGPLLECEIDSADFPEMADLYPSAFRLGVGYRLSGLTPGAGLEISIEVTNVDRNSAALPFGFGLHPYFALPLGPGGDRAFCELKIPASETWDLVGNLPTGLRRPVVGRYDFRQWRALGDETYDDVLTGLTYRPVDTSPPRQWAEVALVDPPAQRRVDLRFDHGFREFVVYAPPNRSIIALEPYTCATDALNLQAQGIDAGLRVLSPGASWSGTVELYAGSFGQDKA